MGVTNHGNQDITYNYHEKATAEDFNKRHLDIRLKGIYKGGYLTKAGGSEITLSPFVLEIGDDSEQISSKSSANATLNSGTLDSGTISSATPVIVLRWAFAEQSDNFVEVHAIDSVDNAQDNDVIVGKCLFSGPTLSTEFDYTDRTFLNVQDLFLKVEATTASEMYARVRAGRVQTSSAGVFISEQKVGPFAVPGSINSRIDLVYVDSSGSIAIQQGAAAPSPSAPDYSGKLVLAEVRLVNGDTNIVQDRITDVRSFITLPTGSFGTGTDKDSENNSLVVNTVYKATSDGFVVACQESDAQLSAYTGISIAPTFFWGSIGGVEKNWDNRHQLMFPVAKDEYWKVTQTWGPNTYWLRWRPLGSGGCVKQ